MENRGKELNLFLVRVFNEILRTEERDLAGRFPDLSLRELHLIEEVCRAEEEGRDNRATAIAAAQRVTAGTLTTAVTLLEKKGYLERRRDEKDRRAFGGPYGGGDRGSGPGAGPSGRLFSGKGPAKQTNKGVTRHGSHFDRQHQ